ncbi:MAG: prepilin-type N-terminal cleavage/methylation domain-containing protein [Tenericutes bacterium]|nr:prepilin-type N-terminal cleavage/methylation domain-containing protein [Mycoplasmatota bacterium]
MRKNAFTLVELLAVIAILAILIIIALPNILKMYNDAQKKVFLQNAQNVNKAAKDSYMSHSMNTSSLTQTVYTFNDGILNTSGNVEMNLTGKKPENGQLVLLADGRTALAFYNGKYCATKSFDSDEVLINSIDEEECNLENIPMGDIVSGCYDFDMSNGTIYSYNYYNYDTNSYCPTDVVIPSTINGVTVKSISGYSFSWRNLESISIPSTVTYIDIFAFS